MKRLALLAFLLVAVAGCPHNPGQQLTGAPSPRGAVETFLSAVRAQDIQALTSVWGDEKGPVRDRMSRDQLDKRSLLMQCYFSHERFRILSDAPNSAGQHIFSVQLFKGSHNPTTSFTVTRGPSNRWYVENAETGPVKALCENPPAGQ